MKEKLVPSSLFKRRHRLTSITTCHIIFKAIPYHSMHDFKTLCFFLFYIEKVFVLWQLDSLPCHGRVSNEEISGTETFLLCPTTKPHRQKNFDLMVGLSIFLSCLACQNCLLGKNACFSYQLLPLDVPRIEGWTTSHMCVICSCNEREWKISHIDCEMVSMFRN